MFTTVETVDLEVDKDVSDGNHTSHLGVSDNATGCSKLKDKTIMQ